MTTAKLRKTSDGYTFKCPGCGDHHHVRTEGPGAKWTFNGYIMAPTFAPSLLVTTGHLAPFHKPSDACWCTYNAEQAAAGEPPAPFVCYRCHSYVRDGKIQFLDDCTHALKGQTVPMLPVENL